VTLVRRTGVSIAVLVVIFMAPGPAARAEQGPDVPDANLRASVLPLDIAASVKALDVAASVSPLEEERSEGGTVTVRISSDVLFDFNRATLTEVARRRIGAIASRLRAATGTVRVSGHSDSVGTPAYNLTLSQHRAEAVRDELRRQLNGASLQVTAIGYGEARPVAPNTTGGRDDPGGRARNRRVEITFKQS
jgi:outer membrane protein OmpA-like peptidoglycan-associated protein